MRKTILMMTLAAMSSGALADWVMIGKGVGRSKLYVDQATIRKTGGKVTMWQVTDYATMQTLNGLPPFMSVKEKSEYDCIEEQSKLLGVAFFAGNMGRGEIVFTHNEPTGWRVFAPSSPSEVFWKYACGKK